MRVDNRHIVWMRALIDGRQDKGQRLGDELRAVGATEPLVPFLYYTFSLAIRRACRGQYTRNWVVQVVADLRAGLDGTTIAVDPVAAESEILRALGEQSVPVFPDGGARATAQAALLWYAVYGMKLDHDQVTALLAEARTMTDRDLDAQAGRGPALEAYGAPRWTVFAQCMLETFQEDDAKRRADIERLQAENRALTARINELEARFGEVEAQVKEPRTRLDPAPGSESDGGAR